MTLIVAAIDANKVWMVTDTAMTDPLEGLRSRSYIQKIEPALDHRGLVAFAGDVHSGTKASREVSGLSAATPALEVLEAASAANAVDFLFARSAGNGPQLWKISAGHAVSVTSTDHIGSHEGFEAFQRVRNGGPAEAPSLSIMTLVSALQCDDPTMDSDVPKGLGTALQAMLFQFASQSERDFGGWPLGYVLTPKGTAFCSYCFNTSDPILGFSIPGAVVPHGSAVAGGFTLSVTELPAQNGTVAYWLQRPGGCVMLKSPEWYGVHWFSGSPTEFVEEIASKLAIKPTLWISDKSAGAPEQIHVLHGEDGLPSMAIRERTRISAVAAGGLVRVRIPPTIRELTRRARPPHTIRPRLPLNWRRVPLRPKLPTLASPRQTPRNLRRHRPMLPVVRGPRGLKPAPRIDPCEIDRVARLFGQLFEILQLGAAVAFGKRCSSTLALAIDVAG